MGAGSSNPASALARMDAEVDEAKREVAAAGEQLMNAPPERKKIGLRIYGDLVERQKRLESMRAVLAAAMASSTVTHESTLDEITNAFCKLLRRPRKEHDALDRAALIAYASEKISEAVICTLQASRESGTPTKGAVFSDPAHEMMVKMQAEAEEVRQEVTAAMEHIRNAPPERKEDERRFYGDLVERQKRLDSMLAVLGARTSSTVTHESTLDEITNAFCKLLRRPRKEHDA
eukprot:CAMPEP_0202920834 /NCGR_PEP_ID=MMETSP1392-20130828/77063_1 /ASSEMBLY_ACC=CAM_ASM_000868 /TAXON_ID=225041 /ORGANISM="Chlamydomonas chlamydogama, Strain SAG 11-48b" /LENGTH=232 /DNA_ID=CAMNT_0049614347 /DNA_START=141 /DNA_END=839 /DNA_ORIENTATION=-